MLRSAMNCMSTGGAMPWLRIAQPEKNPYLRDDQTDQQLAASNYYGPSSRRIAPEISLFFASIPT
jgi:hypothetical protein